MSSGRWVMLQRASMADTTMVLKNNLSHNVGAHRTFTHTSCAVRATVSVSPSRGGRASQATGEARAAPCHVSLACGDWRLIRKFVFSYESCVSAGVRVKKT